MAGLKRKLEIEPYSARTKAKTITVPASHGACGARISTPYGYVDLTVTPEGLVYVRTRVRDNGEQEVMTIDIGEDA